jgi:hypothetical protein
MLKLKTDKIKLNVAWWVPIPIMFATWAFGASICWAQGGWVQNLGWFSVQCAR